MSDQYIKIISDFLEKNPFIILLLLLFIIIYKFDEIKPLIIDVLVSKGLIKKKSNADIDSATIKGVIARKITPAECGLYIKERSVYDFGENLLISSPADCLLALQTLIQCARDLKRDIVLNFSMTRIINKNFSNVLLQILQEVIATNCIMLLIVFPDRSKKHINLDFEQMIQQVLLYLSVNRTSIVQVKFDSYSRELHTEDIIKMLD